MTQGVILPIIVIRRLECVLLAWREAKRAEVLAKRPGLKDKEKELARLVKELIPHDPHGKEPGDQWPETKWRFHRMLSNPPFGVTWGGKDGYEAEARKLEKTRYQAGMPRVNDGALLFLQTMLSGVCARPSRSPQMALCLWAPNASKSLRSQAPSLSAANIPMATTPSWPTRRKRTPNP